MLYNKFLKNGGEGALLGAGTICIARPQNLKLFFGTIQTILFRGNFRCLLNLLFF